MIICGYPCIGKSTISNHSSCIIDLESSHFKVSGRDNTNWEDGYCKLANGLSDQGYIVFVSTHKSVRDKLKELGYDYKLCYPDLTLKEYWINRATDRATRSALRKDHMALDRIKEFYEEDIKDLINDDGASEHLVIYQEYIDEGFDLKDIVF